MGPRDLFLVERIIYMPIVHAKHYDSSYPLREDVHRGFRDTCIVPEECSSKLPLL